MRKLLINKSIFQKQANMFSQQNKKLIDQFSFNDMDIGNVGASFIPKTEGYIEDIGTKLTLLSPRSCYNQLDQFFMDNILYLANDLGYGYGIAIIAITAGIKFLFAPLQLSMQKQQIKMKLIEPELKTFQDKIKQYQNSKDLKGSTQVRNKFSEFQCKHAVGGITSVFAIFQIPFLITWFLCVRYLLSLPDKYPEIVNQGFFWFKDLSVQDPYCVLPIVSACATSMNIQMSHSANSNAIPLFAKFQKYLKYLPFASLPITIFFPSGLVLYWSMLALIQLGFSLLLKNDRYQRFIGIPKYLPGTILEKLNDRNLQKAVKASVQGDEEKVSKDAIKVLLNKPKKKN